MPAFIIIFVAFGLIVGGKVNPAFNSSVGAEAAKIEQPVQHQVDRTERAVNRLRHHKAH